MRLLAKIKQPSKAVMEFSNEARALGFECDVYSEMFFGRWMNGYKDCG